MALRRISGVGAEQPIRATADSTISTAALVARMSDDERRALSERARRVAYQFDRDREVQRGVFVVGNL